MYSSSSVSKRLILVLVLAIQLLLINSVLSLNMTNAYLNHKCLVSQGKYQPGSAYEKNLKSIIKSIATTSNNIAGYEMMSLGGRDDTVSAIFQCRGDSYGTKCRDCFATAVAGLRRRCPRYKGGIIWYDLCLLAISTIDSSIGKIDYENNFCMSNAKKMGGDFFAYEVSWNTLIDNLTTIAMSVQNYSDPAALYGAGERRYKRTKLYGMVQCTKDISPKACEECLLFNNMHFQDCLQNKQGARVVGRSCNFRFELYPFVSKTGPKYLKS